MKTNRTRRVQVGLGLALAMLILPSPSVRELRAQGEDGAPSEETAAAGLETAADRAADTVASAQNVSELLEDASASNRGTSRGGPGLTATFLRLLGWTVAVLAAGAAVAFVLKRYTPVGRSFDAGGLVRVLGRTALSPRHSVVLLRVGNQRVLVVGISGDRMVTLSEIGDPAGVLACDNAFRASLENELGAADFDADPDRDGEGDSGLLPYQRELGKIRRLIGNWRGVLQGSVGGAGAHRTVRTAGAAAGDVETERGI